MNTLKRAVAATEVALVLPATLFMTALFVRNIQPQAFEPARTAQLIVDWYAARPRLGLWVCLIALPLVVLGTGAVTLASAWRTDGGLREATRSALASARAHFAMLLVAVATLTAGAILAIVALHLVTD